MHGRVCGIGEIWRLSALAKKLRTPPEFVKKDFTDSEGIPQRVLVPPDETDLQTGIPVSLNLSALYGHMPAEFQRELYQSLHAQGLVEAADYFKPGASDRFRAAMLTVIRHDFLSVQTLAMEESKHNG